jgi:hypothetical protein
VLVAFMTVTWVLLGYAIPWDRSGGLLEEVRRGATIAAACATVRLLLEHLERRSRRQGG